MVRKARIPTGRHPPSAPLPFSAQHRSDRPPMPGAQRPTECPQPPSGPRGGRPRDADPPPRAALALRDVLPRVGDALPRLGFSRRREQPETWPGFPAPPRDRRAARSAPRDSRPDPAKMQFMYVPGSQSAAIKRPLPRTRRHCMHRSTPQVGRGARSSRDGSTWTTAWVDRARYGLRPHPSAPRACDRARPRDPRRTDGPLRPAADNDFRYDNA